MDACVTAPSAENEEKNDSETWTSDCTYFDLLHSKVKKCEVTANWDDRLWPVTAHGSAQTTIEFHNHQFIQHHVNLVCWWLLQCAVIPHLPNIRKILYA